MWTWWSTPCSRPSPVTFSTAWTQMRSAGRTSHLIKACMRGIAGVPHGFPAPDSLAVYRSFGPIALFSKRASTWRWRACPGSCRAPLFVLIAALIKIDSPGPVFFRHVRVGRRRRPFLMWKFRKMYHNLPAQGPSLTRRYDPRMTRRRPRLGADQVGRVAAAVQRHRGRHERRRPPPRGAPVRRVLPGPVGRGAVGAARPCGAVPAPIPQRVGVVPAGLQRRGGLLRRTHPAPKAGRRRGLRGPASGPTPSSSSEPCWRRCAAWSRGRRSSTGGASSATRRPCRCWGWRGR